MSKRMGLEEAVQSFVKDGDVLTFSGNALHRAPMAFVRELVRQNKQQLQVAKTAAALDVDLLCAFGLMDTVHAGFVSYETKYGLASYYRKAVEAGQVKANEHACYTVICALRGAVMNVPFMPVHGLKYGDLLVENDYFMVVENPFEESAEENPGDEVERVTLVKTIRPDLAVIHAHMCDEEGNAIIHGAQYEDILISRAAKRVVITAETVVKKGKLNSGAEKVDIPGFLVDAVVHVPNGAKPCSCEGKYDVQDMELRTFLETKSMEDLRSWVKTYEKADRSFIGKGRNSGGVRSW
ncbi:CoA transferase subunit A [Salipaludibacillus daqingensis]|uniref:CoA transferase subunit A n=1 Tax=Salipaludibacillus daqingensis TaxID=3041001 RepID=UPI002473A2A1|nr:CoA-transferase [Salipaludibacillus daqingensis]